MGRAKLGLPDVLEGAFKDHGHGCTFGRHPVSRWYAGFAVGLYCRGSGNPRALVRMKAAEGMGSRGSSPRPPRDSTS